jgi:hypothetical protein
MTARGCEFVDGRDPLFHNVDAVDGEDVPPSGRCHVQQFGVGFAGPDGSVIVIYLQGLLLNEKWLPQSAHQWEPRSFRLGIYPRRNPNMSLNAIVQTALMYLSKVTTYEVHIKMSRLRHYNHTDYVTIKSYNNFRNRA